MRRLLLLRHAKAERPERGLNDRDRVLIERGRRDAAIIGAYLANNAILPDRVEISPAARTQETWKIAIPQLGSVVPSMTVDELYDATEHTIFSIVAAAPAAAHTLLLVAHNPGLQNVALMLIASGNDEARDRLRKNLPTSGLVIVDFAIDDWSNLQPRSGRLDRFVSPKLLEAVD
jgi:phosphohistidine phosphatase